MENLFQIPNNNNGQGETFRVLPAKGVAPESSPETSPETSPEGLPSQGETFRVISPQQTGPQYAPETFFGGIKRNIKRAATELPRLIDMPSKVLNWMADALPQGMTSEQIEALDIPESFKERIRGAYETHHKRLPIIGEKLKEKFLPEGEREPRGGWEQVLDNVVGAIPMYLTLGGPAATLGGNIISGVGGEAVEKGLIDRGFNPYVAKGANIATQWVMGGFTKMNPKDLIKRMRNNETSAYNESYKMVDKVKIPLNIVDNVKDGLKKEAELYEFPSKFNKAVIQEIENVNEVISHGTPTITDLMKLKKDINKEAFRRGVHPDMKTALKRVSHTIKGGLESYAAENPAFNSVYFGQAENLAQGINEFEGAVRTIQKSGDLKNVLGDILKKGAVNAIIKAPLKLPQILFGQYPKYLTPYGRLVFKAPKDVGKVFLDGMIDTITTGKGSIAKSLNSFISGKIL